MFLGLGVAFCVITCLGHVAAETANGCCLYLVSFSLVYRYISIYDARIQALVSDMSLMQSKDITFLKN